MREVKWGGTERGEEGGKGLPREGNEGTGLGVGETPSSCFLGLLDSQEFGLPRPSSEGGPDLEGFR